MACKACIIMLKKHNISLVPFYGYFAKFPNLTAPPKDNKADNGIVNGIADSNPLSGTTKGSD